MEKNKVFRCILTLALILSLSTPTFNIHAAETNASVNETQYLDNDTDIDGMPELTEDFLTEDSNEEMPNDIDSSNYFVHAQHISEAEYKQTAENISALNTLSFEEFKEALADGTSASKYTSQGEKYIEDKIYSVNDFNYDYELLVDNTNSSYVSGNIAPKTLPTPNLSIFVNNIDSLKDGSPTTDTVLIWLYNDSDADGDDIILRSVSNFPSGYVLGKVIDNGNNEIGFATRIFNPGTFSIDYFIMDSSQEINGIRYTIEILTVGNYDTYEGSLSSPDDINSYTIPIDFTSISTAAIAFTQTGETDLIMTITDENGQEITRMASRNSIARRWFFIDRPFGVRGIYNYTVTMQVTNNDYHIGSSGYQIMAGDKSHMEEMISYINNAALLGKYTAKNSTYDFRTGYTPSRYESYYKFTADGPATVTAMTHHIQTRFKILDAQTMRTLYDSNDDDSAHRTQYTTPFPHIEKQRLQFIPGTEYYLVLYANNEISSRFIEDNITLSQGMGRLRSSRTVFYADRPITATSSSYSPSATISIGNEMPQTAEVRSVSFVSSDGVLLSGIKSYRVKAQFGYTNWKTSVQFKLSIEYPYTEDGSNNTPLRGNWLYGFMAADSEPRTMTPKLAINYDYEYGD